MNTSAPLNKDVAEELVRNNARLAAIVESSEDAIYGKTLDGILTDWNGAAEKMYGYSAKEIIGQSVLLLAPPEKKEEILHFLEKIRRGERISHHETKRITKAGKIIDVVISISPMKDPQGTIFGAAVIARDVTEINRVHQLADESARLEMLNQAMVGRELKMAELKKRIGELEKEVMVRSK